MRKTLFLSTAITAALAFAVGAHASTYTLTISGTDTGSLTVTGTIAGGDAGSLLLSSGFGTIDGHSVTLVAAPAGTSFASQFTDPVSGIAFDDELFPALTTPLDAAGLEFSAGGGLFLVPYADPVNGFGVFQEQMVLNGKPVNHDSSGDTFRAALVTTATPEPSSMVLLGTGLLGLAGAVRRKFYVNA
jgi:PEP-CTERM motif